jgi:hypothetical protein
MSHVPDPFHGYSPMSGVSVMDSLEILWLRTLEELGDRAAHEIKDTLNGVSLSLEVVRGRSGGHGGQASSVSDFAATAAAQLELATERIDAMLALSRRPREPADVAITLRRMAALLVPAAKADGRSLSVEGAGGSACTRAPGQAMRLALGATLLALLRSGGGQCRLETADGSNGKEMLAGHSPSAVVRFSHESADGCMIDPDIVSQIEQHGIRLERAGRETVLVFPAYP